jgi:hypothetical protein
VDTKSKVCTVFAPSNTEVVSLNPTRGIHVCVCLFCVCVVLCVSKSPIVYRNKKLKKQPMPNKEL